ncbi:MAG TPA: DUF4170 domain-containing protein [Dongiaceae bacterium]|jgi:hypothetical protein|nr:DUF4170 domain-containing protein [Dongiaceae bacterium]
MKRYWVTGGIYADTSFTALPPDRPEERIGPFATYAEAKQAWHKRAWETVDNATARYHIIEEDAAPSWWVVGGTYTDTSFTICASPEGEQWHGPYASEEEAKQAWARLSWQNVDDALTRFRIQTTSDTRLPAGSRNGRAIPG